MACFCLCMLGLPGAGLLMDAQQQHFILCKTLPCKCKAIHVDAMPGRCAGDHARDAPDKGSRRLQDVQRQGGRLHEGCAQALGQRALSAHQSLGTALLAICSTRSMPKFPQAYTRLDSSWQGLSSLIQPASVRLSIQDALCAQAMESRVLKACVLLRCSPLTKACMQDDGAQASGAQPSAAF